MLSLRHALAVSGALAVLVAQGAAAAQDPGYRLNDEGLPVAAPPPATTAPPSPATAPAPPPVAPQAEVVPPAPSDSLAPPPPTPNVAGVTRYTPSLDVYDGSLHLPGEIATRMRALDRDLAALGARGATNLVDGIISLVSGTALVGFGIALNVSSSSTADGNLATYLYVSGGTIIARGLVELLIEPNPLDAAVVYAHMPMTDRTEIDARLAFGEHSLESIAQRFQISRILESSLSIASAAGLCLAYYIPNGFDERQALSWIVLISAGLSAVTGFATLLTRTDAERRWEAYKEMRAHLGVQFGAGPLPGGAAVTASGDF